MNSQAITVSKPVHAEMKMLESERTIEFNLVQLTAVNASLKLIFHNVRSLYKHFTDVSVDCNYLATDIYIFAESRLTKRDKDKDFQMPGFSFYRYDCDIFGTNLKRPAYGLAVYAKSHLDIRDLVCNRKVNPSGAVVEYVIFKIGKLAVAGVYASPKTKMYELKVAAEDIVSRIYKLQE